MFLANYADTLTDAPLRRDDRAVPRESDAVGQHARRAAGLHRTTWSRSATSGLVTGVRDVRDLMQWENGGYFVLRPEIFDVLREGEDIVPHAFDRLRPDRQAARPAVHRLLARRSTRSRTGPSWRRCTSTDRARGCCGTPAAGAPAASLPEPSRLRLTGLPLSRRRARWWSFGAHTRTTSRSPPAACCCRWRGPPGLRVHYVLLTGTPARQAEARAAAAAFLPGRRRRRSTCTTCPTAGCPAHWDEVKDVGARSAAGDPPDLVLAPVPRRRPPGPPAARRAGAARCSATRSLLHYEIPKWDGDIGRPQRLPAAHRRGGPAQGRAAATRTIPSQHARDWWDDEVFLGLARLRGMECRSRYAEAFTVSKSLVQF